MTMMLMISTLAISPAFGDGNPDGRGWTTEDLGARNPYALFLLIIPVGTFQGQFTDLKNHESEGFNCEPR